MNEFGERRSREKWNRILHEAEKNAKFEVDHPYTVERIRERSIKS